MSVRLHLGDCRDLLATLDAQSVDAVICDPPYGMQHRSGFGASWHETHIAGDRDTTLRDEMIAWADARGVSWAMFGSWKVPTPPSARAVLIWDKGPASGMGDLSMPWKSSWEEIAIGGDAWKGKRSEGVLRGHVQVSWESKGRKHPHQKPVSLIKELLRKLPDATTIFDPFMGSGTTGVAWCVKAGLSFIGAEIDPAYFAIAERRIAEAATPLFHDIGVL